eukprot:COSAG02_NODE_199_length_29529_cov_32.558289_16_plen_123_part_00
MQALVSDCSSLALLPFHIETLPAPISFANPAFSYSERGLSHHSSKIVGGASPPCHRRVLMPPPLLLLLWRLKWQLLQPLGIASVAVTDQMLVCSCPSDTGHKALMPGVTIWGFHSIPIESNT